jgi:hypothetical protein
MPGRRNKKQAPIQKFDGVRGAGINGAGTSGWWISLDEAKDRAVGKEEWWTMAGVENMVVPSPFGCISTVTSIWKNGKKRKSQEANAIQWRTVVEYITTIHLSNSKEWFMLASGKMDTCTELAERSGWNQRLLGRVTAFPDLQSSNRH